MIKQILMVHGSDNNHFVYSNLGVQYFKRQRNEIIALNIGQVLLILVLIAFAHKPLFQTHADVSEGAKCQKSYVRKGFILTTNEAKKFFIPISSYCF